MKSLQRPGKAASTSLIAAGFLLILVSCTTVKERVYTSAIYPVFLDDSTASIILTDITETEKSLSAPRTTGMALRGYRVNYRSKSEIVAFIASVNFGDLEFPPTVSPVGDTIFITSTIFRNRFIMVNRQTGALIERTREICCLGRIGEWLQPGTYLARNDSGALIILSLPSGTNSRLNPDSLMGVSNVRWQDLRLDKGKLEAVASFGDSLFYMERDPIGGELIKWKLPGIPERLRPYGEPSVSFGGDRDYLRMTAAEAGGLYYMLPLHALKSSQAGAAWSEEQRWIFNKDVSVKTQNVKNENLSHVDPALVTFRDLQDRVLTEYDFSKLIRK